MSVRVAFAADAVGVTVSVEPSTSSASGVGAEPVITQLAAQDITDTSANIVCETNEAAECSIQWGMTSAYEGGTKSDAAAKAEHTYQLSDLQTGTTYLVRATVVDARGNSVVGTTKFSTTSNHTPLVLSYVQATDETANSARIIVSTGRPSAVDIQYGTSTSLGLDIQDRVLATDHQVTLPNLTSATVYYFQIVASDAFGNKTTSGLLSFSTLARLPMPNVTDATVNAGSTVNDLTWTLPMNVPVNGVLIAYRTDRFPTSPFDGQIIYNQLGTSFDQTGLTNGTTYFYTIFAYDAYGNISSGAIAEGIPAAAKPVVARPTQSTPSYPSQPSVAPNNSTSPAKSSNGLAVSLYDFQTHPFTQSVARYAFGVSYLIAFFDLMLFLLLVLFMALEQLKERLESEKNRATPFWPSEKEQRAMYVALVVSMWLAIFAACILPSVQCLALASVEIILVLILHFADRKHLAP